MSESATGNPLFKGLPMDLASWIKNLEELRERLLGLSGVSGLGLDPKLYQDTLEKLIAHFKQVATSGGQIPTDPGAWMQWLQDSFSSVMDPNKLSSVMDPRAFFEQLQHMMTRGNEAFNLSGSTGMPQLNELLDPGYWVRTSERNLRQTMDLLASWQKPAAAKQED